MFDGWTSNGIHFVELFEIYQTVHEPRKLVLLAFSPFEDCTTQDADAHIRFFEDVLNSYDKSDNCNTNKKIANNSGLLLVGYASHCLNLAGKLAKVTVLKPVLDNVTYWMNILLVEQLDLNEVNKLIDQLKYFSEATNNLQNESINLDDICAYFDLLIDKYPDIED
ncbi:23396_t:CDS:2 [Gigaspora margarita]|uniref:23396_t:CDS:1 n=1 Tax=Gigaspora margarita TaxID=4874 RepID=A0ABM8VX97_GIGMA|nr:23396_t:CDS:2 [Gigaspora margarita]